jgi:5'-phosphate synthase pdxT subunit
MDPLREFGREHVIWGTCAGAIFLSKDIHREQPLLGLMDITVSRNAFGRQIDSFETDLEIDFHGNGNGSHDAPPFHAIFIRAPLIEVVGPGIRVLAKLLDGRIVAAQQGRLLATSFHPELTDDDRFHRYFLEIAK